MAVPTVALVGHPNTGKSTLFNSLTGARQQVGNWPGVTVERKEGWLGRGPDALRVIDLPGVYALDRLPVSSDQDITREFLLAGQADLVVNVVDARSLERQLFLTLQLLETGVPLVVVLNVVDGAVPDADEVDVAGLARHLGCPVVALAAARADGLGRLTGLLREAVARPHAPGTLLRYPAEVEHALDELAAAAQAQGLRPTTRWLATGLLQGDELIPHPPALRAQAASVRARLAQRLHEDLDIVLADAIYRAAHDIAQAVVADAPPMPRTRSDRIDQLALHRCLGIPLFLLAMLALFAITVHVGGGFVDLFGRLGGALFVDGLGALLAGLGAPDWLRVLVADGAGGGIQVVLSFVPIIGVLFLCLSVLEDSGYMARGALLMDRTMRALGLPGKAFVPLVIGFGCNVPAILAARTLDRPRERLLTILMAPFMSCGARLSVYVLFAAAFFSRGAVFVVFGLYLIGIAFAVLTALLLRRTVLRGEVEPFLMELPAYRLPSPTGLLRHAWVRLKSFVVDAGRLIVIVVMAISFLNSLGTDGSFGHAHSRDSVLSELGRSVTPVFAPMGIEEDNWAATVGVLSGVLAKEVVVGTLDALYAQADVRAQTRIAGAAGPGSARGPGREAPAVVDRAMAGDAGATVPRPSATAGTLAHRFDGQVGAFAYLLFILLYSPCVASVATIAREAGKGWALFAVTWSTALAYVVASGFYQLATFHEHAAASLLWLSALLGVAALVGVAFWWAGRQAADMSAMGSPTRC